MEERSCDTGSEALRGEGALPWLDKNANVDRGNSSGILQLKGEWHAQRAEVGTGDSGVFHCTSTKR